MLLSQKRYRQSEKGKATQARKNARFKNATGVGEHALTADEWRGICETYKYHCVYCRRPFPFEELEREHIKPLSRGGKHIKENIVPACKSCNSSKGAKTPIEAGMMFQARLNYV
jgi:5-methylcytosine-specific restriction endonuclease McrA